MIELTFPISAKLFRKIEKEVRKAGYSDAIEWSENTELPQNAEDFAATAIYVICNSGMAKQILATHGRVWDIEHVISRDENLKFMFEPQNLAVSCIECNGAKRATRVTIRDYVRFPRRSQNYLIVHPHFDEYFEHIDIVGDNTYQALSKKGKFTIYHCDLFRYWEREANIRKPIRDGRFERDVGELRFAKSLADAEPILASIRAVLGLYEATASAPMSIEEPTPAADPLNDDASGASPGS